MKLKDQAEQGSGEHHHLLHDLIQILPHLLFGISAAASQQDSSNRIKGKMQAFARGEIELLYMMAVCAALKQRGDPYEASSPAL